MVRLHINFLPISCQPFFYRRLLSVSIDQLDKAGAPHPRGVNIYIYISQECSSLSHPLTTTRGLPSLSTTPSQSKNHPRARASTRITCRPYTLPETEPTGAGLRTMRVTQKAG